MSDAVDLGAVRQAQQKTWSEGDFAMVAGIVEMVAEELVEALDVVPDERVLDVACGSGNGALAAARRAWGNTVGVDFVPALLERGRERAAAERLDVEFVEGDAADLPFGTPSSTSSMSIFGAMFAPEHEKTAAELLRVCKPGGRIGMANWVPDGGVGKMFMTIAKHAPPPPGVTSPLLWGTEEHLRELFGDGGLRAAGRAPQVATDLPLRRPLHRVLPHLLRPDQGRLRTGRPRGRGGADRRPARLPGGVQHRRRPETLVLEAGVPAGRRDAGLRRQEPARKLRCEDADRRRRSKSTVKKTMPAIGPPCPRA